MSRPEFGTKHTCEACAERFYDLNRSPAVCFRCGAVQAPPKPRMYRPIGAPAARGGFGGRPRFLESPKELEPAADVVEDDVEDEEPVEEDDDDIDDAVEVGGNSDDSKEFA